MHLQRLHSTCYTHNPAAKPLRQPAAGTGCANVATWYTEVRIAPDSLSPFAAWLARNVRSTLPCDTVLRLRPQASEAAVTDWRFTLYDPMETTPAAYWEAEARRILDRAPASVQVTSAGMRAEWAPSER